MNKDIVKVGGIILLIDERDTGRFVSWPDDEDFLDAVFQLPGVKEISGPLANGVWSITADIDQDQPVEAHAERLQKAISKLWDQFATNE